MRLGKKTIYGRTPVKKQANKQTITEEKEWSVSIDTPLLLPPFFPSIQCLQANVKRRPYPAHLK